MPSLQIRNLPENLYRVLVERARRGRRSLAQQALVELERLTAGGEGAGRRLETVAALRESAHGRPSHDTVVDPVAAVREDRDR